ncbi:hypothetical protein [Tsukamurella pseudospumae]|uniref:RNA polymerase sigma factor 70 region 4 type 2 domain-containing protein n=1 Tax=Tsukamurella pseudospumae TaxID=239498 RepID=A0A137ZRT5_9ACTN|nr:hypothetical protein [Tsukamurella pseudospumae]KXP00886.1 hypothetical protein AXK61_12825 [Tsukamurella pseudospumae]
MTKRQTPDQKRRELAISDRRAQALELFSTGKTYREIGEQLGTSPAVAYSDVRAEAQAAAERRAELGDSALDILIERSERLYARIWKEVDRGSIRAMEVAVKLLERQAKLYRVEETPAQVNNTVIVAHRDQIDRDIATIRDRLAQLQQQPPVVDGTVEEIP